MSNVRAMSWRAIGATVVGMLLTVSASASAQSLRIVRTADLAFGTVAPRQLRTVVPVDASAAAFTITGRANAVLSVIITLPMQLSSSTGLVSTSNWSATVARGAGGTPVSVVPGSGSPFSVTLGADGLATIRLGASLQPALGTASGTFSGAITMVATDNSTSANSLTTMGTATATVLSPLTVLATPLSFPNVYGGVPAIVSPLAATALRLNIDGALSSVVTITFEALPSQLLRGDGATLPIGAWLARTGNDCSGGATSIAAGSILTLSLAAPVSTVGRSSVCVGATVTPGALQGAGVYTGTVTVSLRYVGA